VETAPFRTTTVTLHGLEVLAFDTVVTSRTQGAVTLVVVLGTIRPVVEDVEIGGWEGGVAFKTDKASTVVSSS
jgi:hypothetical protein